MVQTAAAKKSPAKKKVGGRTAVRLNKSSSSATLHDEASGANGGRRKRGDDVRDRVLAAALECFGAFGFEGTSTRAVAERAKVTHTLVLYHFQSKDQLWLATMERALASYAGEMKAHLDKAGEEDAKAALATFIEQFVRMSARHPQIHRILTMESNQETDRLKWVIDTFLRDHFGMIRELIRRGQDDGTVRQCDPARLYYLIIGAGGTPFTIATEYKSLTNRDVFSEAEVLRIIAFIYEIVFI